MWRQNVSRGLLIGGLALLALAGWLWYADQKGPALTVSSTDLDLHEIPAGVEAALPLAVENHGRRPVRVIGLEAC